MLTYLEVYSSLTSAPDLPLVVGGEANNDQLQIRGMDGIGPVKASITTQAYGSQDGEYLSAVTVGKRNIVLTIGYNPDWVTETVSSLRQKLYAYFQTRQEVKLRFFRDDNPAVEIAGWVESCEPNIFSQDPQMEVSIICPAPDFVAVNPLEVYGIAGTNPDTTDFTVRGTVLSPVMLTVTSTEEYSGLISFQFGTLAPGHRSFVALGDLGAETTYILNSGRGEKVVKNVILGESVSLLNTMTLESVWPYVTPGTNKVRVLLESGEAPWTLQYFERFGGL